MDECKEATTSRKSAHNKLKQKIQTITRTPSLVIPGGLVHAKFGVAKSDVVKSYTGGAGTWKIWCGKIRCGEDLAQSLK